ncbi:MAG: hypothetical protein RIQ50_326, partial [Bacteroidota bacterium]
WIATLLVRYKQLNEKKWNAHEK